MDPKVIANISNSVYYANGNKASLPLINADIRNNPGIFPTPDVMKKLFVLKVQDPKLYRVSTRAWTRGKSGT